MKNFQLRMYSPSILILFLLIAFLLNSIALKSQSPLALEQIEEIEHLIDKAQFQKALDLNRELLERQNSLSQKEIISLYKQRAYVLTLFFERDSAMYYVEKQLSLCKQDSVNLRTEYASALHDLAYTKHSLSIPDPKLENYIQKAIELRRELDPIKLAESRHLLGSMYMKLGKFSEAIEIFEDLIEQVPDSEKRLLGLIHERKGIAYIFMRKHVKAYQHLEQALGLLEAHHGHKNHPDRIESLTYLGYICGIFGKLHSGRNYCEQALDLHHTFFSPDHGRLSVLYYYTGGVYNQLHEYDPAVTYFREAIRLDDLSNGKALNPRKANFYMSLGASLMGQKNYDAALEANKKAVDYFESLPQQHPFIDQLYANIGLIHINREDYESAGKYLDLSMALVADRFPEDHPSLVNKYNAYGMLYTGMKDYAKALTYYDKAVRSEASRQGAPKMRIAQFRVKQGAIYREHYKDYEQALSIQKEGLEAYGLEAWLDEENYELNQAAYEFPRSLIQICTEISLNLRRLASNSEEVSQKEQKAFQILLLGERLIDSTRQSYLTRANKLNLAKLSKELYEAGIALSYDLYRKTQNEQYLNTAFRMSEKSKSLLLLLSLKHIQALQSSNLPAEVLEKEHELEEQIMRTKGGLSKWETKGGTEADSLEKVLFTLKQSRDSLIHHLEDDYPQYFRMKYDPHLPKITQVQSQLLAADELGLVYFLGKDHVYRFEISQASVELFKTDVPENFKQNLKEFRELTYAPVQSQNDRDFLLSQEAFARQSHSLYELLLGAKIRPFKKLKIVPDGTLGMLNFDLLLAEMPQDIQNIRNYPFVIKDFGISYLYSMGLLQYLSETQTVENRATEILAFRPVYPPIGEVKDQYARRRTGFGPLKYSAEEVQGIQKYFGGKLLEAEAANEENFYRYAKDYSIIHISSHAQIPEQNPHAAFVALTQTTAEAFDDSLQIEELYAQRLNAEMVVLSACETGIGELEEGEGIMSLGRAFTYAGARSLVMSLWEVNDASTAEIMKLFYEQLSQGKPKDEALRQAKLQYLSTSDRLRSQPYFWAAFIAQGDMKALPPGSSNLWVWLLSMGMLMTGFVFWYRLRKRKLSHINTR